MNSVLVNNVILIYNKEKKCSFKMFYFYVVFYPNVENTDMENERNPKAILSVLLSLAFINMILIKKHKSILF